MNALAPNNNLIPPALRQRRLSLESLAPSPLDSGTVTQDNQTRESETQTQVAAPAATVLSFADTFNENDFAVSSGDDQDDANTAALEDEDDGEDTKTTEKKTRVRRGKEKQAKTLDDMFQDGADDADDESQAATSKRKAPEADPAMQKALADANAKIEELTSKFTALSEQAAQRAAQEANSRSIRINPEDMQLTEDERTRYSGSLPVIAKVASQIVDRLVGSYAGRLEALEDSLEKSTSSIKTELVGQRAKTYQQQLALTIPDLDATLTSAGFSSYLRQTIPYSGGVTVESRLREAHRAQDLPTVKAIVEEYKTKANATSQTLDGFRQPKSTGTPAATTSDTGSPKRVMLAASKRKDALAKFRAGLLSEKQLKEVQAIYAKAEAEDRVDFNA